MVICGNCSEEGHNQRTCTKPCFCCKEAEHRLFQCDKKDQVDDHEIRSENAEPELVMQLQAMEDENCLLMEELRIERQENEDKKEKGEEERKEKKRDLSDLNVTAIWEMIEDDELETRDAIVELERRMKQDDLKGSKKKVYEKAVKLLQQELEESEESEEEIVRPLRRKKKEDVRMKKEIGKVRDTKKKGKEKEVREQTEREAGLEAFLNEGGAKSGEYGKLWQRCMEGAERQVGAGGDKQLRCVLAIDMFVLAGELRHGWDSEVVYGVKGWAVESMQEYGEKIFAIAMLELVRELDLGRDAMSFVHGRGDKVMMMAERRMNKQPVVRHLSAAIGTSGEQVQRMAQPLVKQQLQQKAPVQQVEKPAEALRCLFCGGFGHARPFCHRNPESPKYDPEAAKKGPAPKVEYLKGKMPYCWSWTNGRECSYKEDGPDGQCLYAWKHVCGFVLPDGTRCMEAHKAVDEH